MNDPERKMQRSPGGTKMNYDIVLGDMQFVLLEFCGQVSFKILSVYSCFTRIKTLHALQISI